MGVLAETGVQFIDRKDATRENGIHEDNVLQWNDRFDLIWVRRVESHASLLFWVGKHRYLVVKGRNRKRLINRGFIIMATR